jgi:glycine dehydrogenase
MESLKNHYSILYTGENGRVAHEMIIDCRPIKQEAGIDTMDIAKRLIDYGFHSPTVSFPVAGTLMIEPTESEDKAELDKFVSAMIKIAQEIEEVKNGIYPLTDNVLVNAPHPAEDLLKDKWEHAYSREKAAYPLSYLINNKYWVPISRVDNAYGDRNLICTCPEIASFAENA